MKNSLVSTFAVLGTLAAGALLARCLWEGKAAERAGQQERDLAVAAVPTIAGAPSTDKLTAAEPTGPVAPATMQRYQDLKRRLQDAAHARRALIDQKEPPSPGAPPLTPLAGTLEREYISQQMKEIVPLIRECYDMALERLPDLEGKVVISSTIIAEPEIGGLVESSEVLTDQSDIVDPGFLECVQETIYALELKAPEGGGSVTMRYPLVFRSE